MTGVQTCALPISNDVIYVPFDNAKFFGVSHFTGVMSLAISTLSFGLLIYGLVTQFSKP